MKNRNLQSGFTLLEILVTLIILAIGLLGIASLQNSSIKLSYDAYLRSQAALLSYDLMDRIRANPAGNYVFNHTAAITAPANDCIGVTDNCNSAALAAADVADWVNQASSIFPDGNFAVTREGDELNLIMSWVDRYENEDIGADPTDPTSTAEDIRSSFVFAFDI